MNIKLSGKFSDQHLDAMIDGIFRNFQIKPNDKYTIDLSDVEYIANQELLVISSLLSLFISNNVEIKLIFFKKEVSTSDIPSRVKKQIIELWVVWEVWRIVPDNDYYKYFGLDGNSIERLQEEEDYYPKKAELYSRYGVTPYVQLDFINNYNANEIQNRINNIFKLSHVIKELLIENNCYHPFTTNSLSTIISEELYLNFLDHSLKSAFTGFNPFASMSIAFRNKLQDERKYLNEVNFKTEQIPESKSFFYDFLKKEFHNRPYIEFSFLDFGSGIPKTLFNEFNNTNDSEILKFAFQHNSSRHPITVLDNKPEEYISRGLFDILTIVKRYGGLLIVRSNYGKILYDFSNSNNIEKAFKQFGEENHFFPGTLISLYVPAIQNEKELNETSIKPELIFQNIKPVNKFYYNINDVLKSINSKKETLYSNCLIALRNIILGSSKEASIIYLSFLGYNIEDRIAKKIIIYLLTDYDINIKTNLVIIHGPKNSVIDEIANTIKSLSSVYKKYKIHPLPIINYDIEKNEIRIKWLGVYDSNDTKKLNDLLYEEYSLAKTDFNEPSYLEGHILSFDTYGNLISNFPDRTELINIIKNEYDILIRDNIRDLLDQKEGIIKDDGLSLYICNGNYYQKEYIEINNLINNKEELENLTTIFYKKLETRIKTISDLKFISITSTSNKILQSFVDMGLINEIQSLTFDNYQSFNLEINKEKIDPTSEFILICDVISTGYLTNILEKKLKDLGAQLKHVGVIVSVIDESFRKEENQIENFSSKLISLYDYKIMKYEAKDISNELINKNLIRINPYTNIPIRLSFEETNYNDSIIFHSIIDYDKHENQISFKNDFLDSVSSKDLKVGYFNFNNLIHPYFFNTKSILKNLPIELLKKIFNKINKDFLKSEKIGIFYPRNSGIKSNLFFTNLKTALGNDNLEVIEIDRINSKEGWRFPHNSKFLSSKVDGGVCLIIDDGTSTGDSLMQMIDEISFYNAKEIILLCFIGRVADHKREFFSRVSKIKVKNGTQVNLSIYFATHWHIPTYYLDSNPIIEETKWLNELINISNTPFNISKIAARILKAIEPKKDNFKDYKYLPKIIGRNEVPKKDLTIRREEIGKVIGFRVYEENFKYFNFFIKKYSQKTKETDRYKEIELICACFVFEPYLYEKLTKSLPDITILIENFVKTLIYSYSKYEKFKSYDWDKRDIIHLFFIVFKDDKLVKELTPENFKKLIEFTKPKESSLDYVLYKLLKYFPLNNQFENNYKFDLEFKKLIKELIKTESKNVDALRNYLSFINTLPSKEDFENQLYNLQSHYEKDEDEDLHTDKKQFDHNVSAISSLIDKIISFIENNNNILLADIQKLKNLWLELSSFVTPILSFTSSFPNFITPSPRLQLYTKIEGKDIKSVRSRMGFNSNTILSIDTDFTDIYALKQLDENIKIIQLAIDKNSYFYKIVFQNKTNLKDLIMLMKNEFAKQSISFEIEFNDSFDISVPVTFSEDLICKEIVTNYQKHSLNELGLIYEYHLDHNEDSFTIILKNKIKPKEISNSSREGLRCLNELSKSVIFGFKYNSETVDDEFVQTLIFKKNQ